MAHSILAILEIAVWMIIVAVLYGIGGWLWLKYRPWRLITWFNLEGRTCLATTFKQHYHLGIAKSDKKWLFFFWPLCFVAIFLFWAFTIAMRYYVSPVIVACLRWFFNLLSSIANQSVQFIKKKTSQA